VNVVGGFVQIWNGSLRLLHFSKHGSRPQAPLRPY